MRQPQNEGHWDSWMRAKVSLLTRNADANFIRENRQA